MFAIMVVLAPGAQGAEVTGTHGVGVRTPDAADVAAAVAGLAMDMHMMKEGMLTTGL
jgi:putative intracellular protease/amidase